MSQDSAQNPLDDLIRSAWDKEQPAGWFEPLYEQAASGRRRVPWAYMKPNPLLLDWLERERFDGKGKQALVIGCGLGDDAEALAERGFNVTAFDISESAINWAKERFPKSRVNYHAMDLFHTPASWHGAFDFVLESRTIQSLPYTLADQVMARVVNYLAPGGTLLTICLAREPEEPRTGIPWLLSRDDLAGFQALGLTELDFDDLDGSGRRHFRAAYRSQ